MPKISDVRKRDAEATKKRILLSAKKAFAKKGLAGARVDDIAENASANKRMIYHYFGNKEALFLKTLEDAYLDIRLAEQKLELDEMPAKDALDNSSASPGITISRIQNSSIWSIAKIYIGPNI